MHYRWIFGSGSWQRVIVVDSGCSQTSVARRFGVCAKTVQRLVARAARGELAPRPHPGRAPRLRPDQEAAFVAMVEENSDWTVEQLSLEWERRSGVFLPRSTLHDHLQCLKGRYKKESNGAGTL